MGNLVFSQTKYPTPCLKKSVLNLLSVFPPYRTLIKILNATTLI